MYGVAPKTRLQVHPPIPQAAHQSHCTQTAGRASEKPALINDGRGEAETPVWPLGSPAVRWEKPQQVGPAQSSGRTRRQKANLSHVTIALGKAAAVQFNSTGLLLTATSPVIKEPLPAATSAGSRRHP